MVALWPAIWAAARGVGSFLGRHGKQIGDTGSVLGAAAGGRARGRETQGNLQNTQDEIRQRMYDTLTRNILGQNDLAGRMYQTQTGNTLTQDTLRQRGFEQGSQNIYNRAKLGADLADFQLKAPTTRFSQGLMGNLAANMQDVQAQVPGRYAKSLVNFTGGLRPSALGAGGRAIGQQLASLAASKMGQDTFALPEFGAAPALSPLGGPPTPSALPAPPDLTSLPQSSWVDKLISGGAIGGGLLGALFQPRPQQPGPQLGPPASLMGPESENLPGYDPNNPLGRPSPWRLLGGRP